MIRYTLFLIAFMLTLICLPSYAQGVVNRSANRPTSSSAKANQKKTSSVKVSEPDGYINGHGYVDLGLPSGTKWATCNVGASKPEEFGDYFAWGETNTNSNYNDKNRHTYGKQLEELKSEGIININNTLCPKHDAASAIWMEKWKMPSKSDFDELINNCKWEWKSIGGKNGYVITGVSDKSIFLPAGGTMYDGKIENKGNNGFYWSGSVSSKMYEYANSYSLFFDNQNHRLYWDTRFEGRAIRPVCK